jgi:hypothetical protein
MPINIGVPPLGRPPRSFQTAVRALLPCVLRQRWLTDRFLLPFDVLLPIVAALSAVLLYGFPWRPNDVAAPLQAEFLVVALAACYNGVLLWPMLVAPLACSVHHLRHRVALLASASLVACAWEMIVLPVTVVATTFLFTTPQGSGAGHISVAVLVGWAVGGQAQLWVAAARGRSRIAQLCVLAVVFQGVCWAGVRPSLRGLRTFVPAWLLAGLSFARWAVEAGVSHEVAGGADTGPVEALGFQLDNKAAAYGALFTLGFLARAAACWLMLGQRLRDVCGDKSKER